MFVKKGFTINGVSSDDIGVDGAVIVRTDNSHVIRPVFGARSVRQDKSSKGEIPTFLGLDRENIEFDLKISFKKLAMLTREAIAEVVSLFSTPTYVPFTSEEFPGVIFYVLPSTMEVEKDPFTEYGWLNVHLMTSAPYAFTTVTTSVFDLSAITVPTDIVINNLSNIGKNFEPKLVAVMKDTNVVLNLINETNANRKFELTGLTALETLTIDNRLRKITSSTGNPRIANLTDKKWLELVPGNNTIQVTGKCHLTFELQFPIYI